jgi:hypothetical protein
VGNSIWPPLSDFVQYLPQIRRMNLGPDELRSIPVHFEPPDAEEFLSLGELPAGVPPSGPDAFGFVGTRQAYAYRSDLPDDLWGRLEVGLMPRRASGTGGTGMFGTPDETVVDDDDVRKSWRNLDAGAPSNPEEL